MPRKGADVRRDATRNQALAEFGPAKVNLTLRVVGRRGDGYHDIESLVVFARTGDRLTLALGDALELTLRGPYGPATGELGDNLVLKAAKLLAAAVPGLRLGRFVLDKRLPVAAGLGGGSADAAAALRLLARANEIALDEPRLFAAARATGADVPVCLDPRPRLMRGIGDVLSPPLDLPEFPAVLVNPGVAVATEDVFSGLGLAPGEKRGGNPVANVPVDRAALFDFLRDHGNDLESTATDLEPAIANILEHMKMFPCWLARMSGSGATCFALFDSQGAADRAARAIKAVHPHWWVRATTLGSGSAN